MKPFLTREAVEEDLKSFRERQGEARGVFALALSATWRSGELEEKTGLLETMDFAEILSQEAIPVYVGLGALLNMDMKTYSLLAPKLSEPIEVDPEHLIEADLCVYAMQLADLEEEARIAAATENLTICGPWNGYDTIVRVKDFFEWAEGEGFFVPEAIQDAMLSPGQYAVVHLRKNEPVAVVAQNLRDIFKLSAADVARVFRPLSATKYARKDLARMGRSYLNGGLKKVEIP